MANVQDNEHEGSKRPPSAHRLLGLPDPTPSDAGSATLERELAACDAEPVEEDDAS
jgi:hypothetical protein